MSRRRSLALASHEGRLLRRDPFPLVILVAMPLAIIAFFRPALALALFSEGYTHANGSEQAVPGIAVTFAFFIVGFVGLAFFRERGWNTWDRLRGAASVGEIVTGKLLPIGATALLQIAVLFGVGAVAFGFRITGSPFALALMCMVLPICPIAFGVALVSVARTLQQVNVVANVGTVVLAGVGGALVPLSLLPAWAAAIAPLTPTYWAMRGFRSVVLEGGGVGSVLLPIAVLLAFAALSAAVGLVRLNADEGGSLWA
jgi:ABC-2 type transport system permease protein